MDWDNRSAASPGVRTSEPPADHSLPATGTEPSTASPLPRRGSWGWAIGLYFLGLTVPLVFPAIGAILVYSCPWLSDAPISQAVLFTAPIWWALAAWQLPLSADWRVVIFVLWASAGALFLSSALPTVANIEVIWVARLW